DVDDEVEIARLAAVVPGAALAGDAHAGAVGHPCGDLHVQLLARLDHAGSAARRAGTTPDPTRPLARGARGRPPDRDGRLRAAQGVHEVDLDGILDVLPTPVLRLLGGAAEHLVQDVREAAVVARASGSATALRELEAEPLRVVAPAEREPLAALRP